MLSERDIPSPPMSEIHFLGRALICSLYGGRLGWDELYVLAKGSHQRGAKVPLTVVGAPIFLPYPHEYYTCLARGMRVESPIQHMPRFRGGPLCIHHKATQPG